MEAEQPLTLETLNIIGPDHYMQKGYPHREWTYLRKHKPVFWCEYPKTDPFWAITKHADIIQISKQPRLFLNGPRLLIFVPEEGFQETGTPPFRHLLDMDPPDHGEYRLESAATSLRAACVRSSPRSRTSRAPYSTT